MDNLWLSTCELLLRSQSVQETQLVQVSKPKLNMEWKWISFLTLVKLIILMWDESWGSNVKQLQIFIYVSSSQCGSNRELTLHLTLLLCGNGIHLHPIFACGRAEPETITENHFRIRGPCEIPAEFMATVAFGEPIEMLINLRTAVGRQLSRGWHHSHPSLNATIQLS